MIHNLQPYLISLALCAKTNYDKESYETIIKLTRKISKDKRFKDIEKDYKEIYIDFDYDDSENGDLSNFVPISVTGRTGG